MLYSYKVKQAFQNIATIDMMQKIFRFEDKSIGTILMLHRIDRVDPARVQCNEHIKISPEFLESLIVGFRNEGYTFISMDELQEVLSKGKKARKLIALTLDDGYRDNYTNGLPIFKKYSVPFTVYISTAMIEKEFIYWWDILDELITGHDEIILENGRRFRCQGRRGKERAFMRLREEVMGIHPKELPTVLPKMFGRYQVDLYKRNEENPLTWKQVKDLKEEPLATIGSHTHSHIGLNFFSESEIIADIKKANDFLLSRAGIVPRHFCYPYGSLTGKEDKFLSELGFETAVTANPGNVYAEDAGKLFFLPRIFVSEKSNPRLRKVMTWLKYRRQ